MPSSKTSRRKKRLKNLHLKNPHCHWCGMLTKIDRVKTGDRPDDLMATLDHVYSRLHPARRTMLKLGRFKVQLTVLACHSCNSLRSAIENRIYPQNHKHKCTTLPSVPTD